jgi:hypothetical protein
LNLKNPRKLVKIVPQVRQGTEIMALNEGLDMDETKVNAGEKTI